IKKKVEKEFNFVELLESKEPIKLIFNFFLFFFSRSPSLLYIYIYIYIYIYNIKFDLRTHITLGQMI
ncbi:MAG: hypothetical protein N7Q72_02360, partial [Spiroplasma sp. Tabriz.8]|nr:hypothetical protein [Spiroplasma sp. Tabriz.8]